MRGRQKGHYVAVIINAPGNSLSTQGQKLPLYAFPIVIFALPLILTLSTTTITNTTTARPLRINAFYRIRLTSYTATPTATTTRCDTAPTATPFTVTLLALTLRRILNSAATTSSYYSRIQKLLSAYSVDVAVIRTSIYGLFLTQRSGGLYYISTQR